MKKLIKLSAVFITTLFFAQNLSKRETQLVKLLDKSFYSKDLNADDKKEVAKKYNCLQKNYKIVPENEKEFLSKTAFFKKFPEWKPEENHDVLYLSPFQAAYLPVNWNNENNELFPKCFKEEDLKKITLTVN